MEQGKLVWVSGCSGAGKTFTGDYLEVICGFKHIDGDYLFHSNSEEDKKLVENLRQAFFKYWFEEKESPEELWVPYYQKIFEKTRQYQKENPTKNVVISLSCYNRQSRDYIRNNLSKDIIYIMLECSKDELVNRAWERFVVYSKKNEKTPEEMFEVVFKKIYSKDEFRNSTLDILRGLQPIEKDEKLCFALDVSNKDRKVFEELHQLLDLKEVIEEIPIQKIKDLNYSRFQKYEENKK
eukprot:gene10823-3441_t